MKNLEDLAKKTSTIIPARFGSKRVKLKSFRLLDGKPLIQYIIDTLKETKYLSHDIYINSDSGYLHEIAKENNIEFYKRDPKLATSDSLIDEYIYDFVKQKKPKYLAVVNPTSPFIRAESLDNAWKYFIENNFKTLLSCERVQTHCFLKGEPVNFSIDQKHPRSQDLEPILALNFAITIWDCEEYVKNYEASGYGVYTKPLGFYCTEGNANIDIDYEDDFALAEYVSRSLKSKEEYPAQYHSLVKQYIENDIETGN